MNDRLQINVDNLAQSDWSLQRFLLDTPKTGLIFSKPFLAVAFNINFTFAAAYVIKLNYGIWFLRDF